jgi:hypothetical protein
MSEGVTAYPLHWPRWVKRASFRTAPRFTSDGKPITVTVARERLQAELDRLGAKNAVLSTNMELRLDGRPRSDRRAPDDPGVAVYFHLGKKSMCMPCDKWDTVAGNIAAIAGHIDALRRIERYGVQSIEQAFAGCRRQAVTPKHHGGRFWAWKALACRLKRPRTFIAGWRASGTQMSAAARP